MVLGLAQEQQRDAPARMGSWTSLTTTTCTLSWGFMRPALVLAVILCCALRAPLVRLLLQVAEPAPRLFPLDLLLELRALQLEPHAQLELQAQLVFLVCTQVILLELPGLECGGPLGDELGGGASGDERLTLLDNAKLKLRGGGGLLASPLHHRPVVAFRSR